MAINHEISPTSSLRSTEMDGSNPIRFLKVCGRIGTRLLRTSDIDRENERGLSKNSAVERPRMCSWSRSGEKKDTKRSELEML